MIHFSQSFDSLTGLKQVLGEKYAHWLVLGAGADHEDPFECRLIECDRGEFDFGLGVALTVRGVRPKALMADAGVVLVAFDTFISALDFRCSATNIRQRELRLDGTFVDMLLLENGHVCVVHEIGAMVVTQQLDSVWAVSTDIVSNWSIDTERGILTLNELYSDEITTVSLEDGKKK